MNAAVVVDLGAVLARREPRPPRMRAVLAASPSALRYGDAPAIDPPVPCEAYPRDVVDPGARCDRVGDELGRVLRGQVHAPAAVGSDHEIYARVYERLRDC